MPFSPGPPKSVGTPPITISGTPSSGQVVKATSASAATWQDESGGGATIAHTTNLINGDGSGNGSDSGLDPTKVPTIEPTPSAGSIPIWVNATTIGDSGETPASFHNAVLLTGVVQATAGGAGATTGILKADGSGNVSAATAGTDYLTPDTVQTIPDGSTAVTQDSADESTKIATTSFTQAAISDTAIVAGTGWTANASTGDKTISVQDYDATTLDGMTANLNLVLTGFGTAIADLANQVEDLTKKFQATETALANRLRPNA